MFWNTDLVGLARIKILDYSELIIAGSEK